MADEWYVGRNGQRSGPFSGSQVRQMAARGELGPADMLWKEGMADWAAAATISGLFGGPPAASPAPTMNPYAAPTVSDLTVDASLPGSSMRPIEYAEFFPRVGAALLDWLFLGLMQCVPAFGMGFVFVMLAGGDQDAAQAAMAAANVCSQLLGFVIGLTYYVVLETSPKQGTWGKQIVGIKVTDLQGNRITVGRAFGRYFAKIITGCTLGIGFLMPLFTEKKQTLHDMIAGCLALKK
jgi:uncharacterized RDD family membrane protein YckC